MDESCDLFVLYKQYPSGGKIWLMLGLETTGSDYNDILAIANCLAKEGHEVKVLHAVHYKDPIYREVFGELIGTKYYRKCPDGCSQSQDTGTYTGLYGNQGSQCSG